MFTILSHFLGNFLVGILIAALSLVLLSIAALLRLLPRFLQFVRLCLRGFLILSVRLYGFLFSLSAPAAQELLQVDLMANPWRMIACVLVSLLLGLLVLLLTQSPRLAWILLPFLLHGLGVGLTWDELEHPNGIQMGTRIE